MTKVTNIFSKSANLIKMKKINTEIMAQETFLGYEEEALKD